MVKINHRSFIVLVAITTLIMFITACQLLQGNKNNILNHKPLDKTVKGTIHYLTLSELSGWDHLTLNQMNEDDKVFSFKNKYQDYAIHKNISVNENQTNTQIHTVLLRKIADWDKQHTNGLSLNFEKYQLTFSQLLSLSFTLAIDEGKSFIPSVNSANQHFSIPLHKNTINVNWLNELLAEPPMLKITLVGSDHQDQKIKTPIAQFSYPILQFNNSQLINIRPLELSYYWQKNYLKAKTDLAQIGDETITGALITLDTANNKTLRSYLSGNDRDNFPSYIKEMYIELATSITDPAITIR